MGYPSGAKLSKRSYLIARINYPKPCNPTFDNDTNEKTGILL
jgi:hypothetical protein